jgi:hypothetical protein
MVLLHMDHTLNMFFACVINSQVMRRLWHRTRHRQRNTSGNNKHLKLLSPFFVTVNTSVIPNNKYSFFIYFNSHCLHILITLYYSSLWSRSWV